jgi:high-affinity iron transporter
LRFGLAAGLGLAAIVLAIAVALPGVYSPAPAALAGGGHARLTPSGSRFTLSTDPAGTPSAVSFDRAATKTTVHDGAPARQWTSHETLPPADSLAVVSLTQLVNLNGGRLPIGIDPIQNPGPFAAGWTKTATTSVWMIGDTLLDAQRSTRTILTLTGGGLVSTRTLTLAASPATNPPQSWRVASSYPAAVITGTAAVAATRSELMLWKLWLPLALTITALVLCGFALRGRLGRKAGAAPATAANERRSQAKPASARA